MIQRKQSLFLLAVAIIGLVMLVVPFFMVNGDTQSGTLHLLNAGGIGNVLYLIILDVLIIALAFLTIFLFRNRRLQFRLSNLLLLFNVFLTGLAFLLPFEAALMEVHITYWAFLPIVAALFAFLAAHYIKKDELLVRSADRIR